MRRRTEVRYCKHKLQIEFLRTAFRGVQLLASSAAPDCDSDLLFSTHLFLCSGDKFCHLSFTSINNLTVETPDLFAMNFSLPILVSKKYTNAEDFKLKCSCCSCCCCSCCS